MDRAGKASFLLYNSYRVMVDALPDEDAGALVKAVFALAAGEEGANASLSPMANLVYLFIAQQMAEDEEKYAERCEKNRKSIEARWGNKNSGREDAAGQKVKQKTEMKSETKTEQKAEPEAAGKETNAEEGKRANEKEYDCMNEDTEDTTVFDRIQSYTNECDNDNEDDNDNDLKEKDSFGVQKESASAAPQPASVEIPLKDGTGYLVPEEDLEEYRGLYPAIDVLHECQKAARWCRDNPSRQKTRQGVRRFLGAWLSRAAADCAQNTAGTTGNGANMPGNRVAAPKPNAFHNFYQRGTDYDALLHLAN